MLNILILWYIFCTYSVSVLTHVLTSSHVCVCETWHVRSWAACFSSSLDLDNNCHWNNRYQRPCFTQGVLAPILAGRRSAMLATRTGEDTGRSWHEKIGSGGNSETYRGYRGDSTQVIPTTRSWAPQRASLPAQRNPPTHLATAGKTMWCQGPIQIFIKSTELYRVK